MASIFDELPEALPDEQFTALIQSEDVTIERIVSTGQATPEGQWMVQDKHEWVMLVSGSATLSFDDESNVKEMTAGDYVTIPGGSRHRVERTIEGEPTIWLAVHYT
ncbi:MAG: cupin domain-containing protein [Alphaproteobacteria bacterium]|nr:cupin domain-containing protein [Alphaproteobacteria bacterium]